MSVLQAVKELDARQWTLLAAGLATIGACHVTSKIITEHLKYWNKPREQLPIIFIVLMVPIFAVDSYVGEPRLCAHPQNLNLDTSEPSTLPMGL